MKIWSFLVAIMCVNFCLAQNSFNNIEITFLGKRDVFLCSEELKKLDQLIDTLNTNSNYSYELVITNEYYVDFQKHYDLDKKRLESIANYIVSKGVAKNQIITNMQSLHIVTGITTAQESYFTNKTKKDKNYLYKKKLLAYRKLSKIN